MQLDPGVAALLGAVVGAAGTSLGVYVMQLNENRRHLRQTAATVAVENWKGNTEIARALAARGLRPMQAPLFTYALYMTRAFALMEQGDLDENRIRAIIRDLAAIDRIIAEERQEHEPAQHDRRPPTAV